MFSFELVPAQESGGGTGFILFFYFFSIFIEKTTSLFKLLSVEKCSEYNPIPLSTAFCWTFVETVSEIVVQLSTSFSSFLLMKFSLGRILAFLVCQTTSSSSAPPLTSGTQPIKTVPPSV